jgi:hypothetical protein
MQRKVTLLKLGDVQIPENLLKKVMIKIKISEKKLQMGVVSRHPHQ